jgi:hypothetical protein
MLVKFSRNVSLAFFAFYVTTADITKQNIVIVDFREEKVDTQE